MNRKIWEDQKQFNTRFFEDLGLDLDNMSLSDKVKWAKEFYFHINKELTDLIDCLPHWKMHYKHDLETDRYIKSNLKEEFIDSLKYLMGLGQTLGISYDDIITVYEEKSKVVQQKYDQSRIFDQLRNKEIIIFDIDGVINNYPDCYLDWVESQTGIRYNGMDDIKLKLDIETYEKIKEEYRTSGAKRTQYVVEDAVSTMQKLKELDETIILYTTRPVGQYKRIYSDTLYWLKKNKIPFDAIFWSDLKKEDIYKLDLNIKFIVEDDVDNTRFFNHEGYKVYLIDKDHNRGYENTKTVRLNKVSEILNHYKRSQI